MVVRSYDARCVFVCIGKGGLFKFIGWGVEVLVIREQIFLLAGYSIGGQHLLTVCLLLYCSEIAN